MASLKLFTYIYDVRVRIFFSPEGAAWTDDCVYDIPSNLRDVRQNA